LEEGKRSTEGEGEGSGDCQRRQVASPGLADATSEEVEEHCASERQGNDQPEEISHERTPFANAWCVVRRA
jgi:hypothetical protein